MAFQVVHMAPLDDIRLALVLGGPGAVNAKDNRFVQHLKIR